MTELDSADHANCNGETVGSVTSQLVAISAWLLQICLFAVAMVFRYSGEPGGWAMEYMLAEGPVSWRPAEFDWPGLPLAIAVLVLSIWALFRNRKAAERTVDIGQICALLCLSIYALSNGSAEALFTTVLAIWLCSIISARFHTNTSNASYTATAATILLIACLASAYMHVQHGCSLMEGTLIILSAIFGAASTGMQPSSTRVAKLALPAWFTLILLVAWLSGKTVQPSMRVLVILELSAAFIAARHYLLAQQQSDVQDTATPSDNAGADGACS
ncbi:MAG: hypothetical protein A2W80_09940 [Candidatus Riflebacteria bacterium GWC2_50_8]|nr:MAG: hypothetical protein A2W80_09940 [Candidatus Riflebacteria bacterium GWC2_50_8]